MEAYVILCDVDNNGIISRQDLENMEAMVFTSVNSVKIYLRDFFGEEAVTATRILPISEFTTDWNDTDDGYAYVNPKGTWIGYVYIAEKENDKQD